MKPLPYIAIEGVGKTKEEVLDSLIAIEPLLVMMGYDVPFEEWNNNYCENFMSSWHTSHIICKQDDGKDLDLGYHNHNGCFADVIFKSTEIHKLIKYMIDNKFIK